MRKGSFIACMMLCFAMLIMPSAFAASASVGQENTTQHASEVMEQFQEDVVIAPERAISTNRKHQILFFMGAALLLLILLAAGFGIAMGIFDKDVFVWHVLSAGLATTLAIAHGIVAFVWFYPS